MRRQRHGDLPKDPATLHDLVIPEEWKTTGKTNPRPFLNHDSGPDERQRILVYSAEEQLRHLGQADTWYMDGNFAMSLNVFDQLYCIRAPLGETTISCTYAFLPGKSSHIYEELLQAIVHKMEELHIYPDPKIIITDFELAVRGYCTWTSRRYTRLLLPSVPEQMEEDPGTGKDGALSHK